MPEPYKFPELPKNGFTVNYNDPKLPPIRIGFVGEVPLFLFPPVEETNNIGFVVLGNKEMFRLAWVLDDSGKLAWIKEDGMVIETEEIVRLVFKIVLGSERYEKMNAEAVIESTKPQQVGE